jgi:hypothetical protein
MIGTTEHYPPAPQDSSNQSGVSWAAILRCRSRGFTFFAAADAGCRIGFFGRFTVGR